MFFLTTVRPNKFKVGLLTSSLSRIPALTQQQGIHITQDLDPPCGPEFPANKDSKKEDAWKDGKLHGHFTEWHQNGQKAEDGSYEDGKEDGLFTLWHENGQKKSEFTYKDGKRHGPMTQWHENGQKRSELVWKDDEPIFARFWNRAGEEVLTSEDARK